MEREFQLQTGKKLMYIVMFTLALSAMSVLVFSFVLPQIREEFHLTTAQVSWVTSAYGLIYAIGTVIYGKLADRYKLKNLLTFGLLWFAGGSLIGLVSHTFGMMMVGRCLQAVGAAAIPATAMLIPLRYFPPDQRGSAMGMAFVGLALGGALGPVISAAVVSVVHWRWLFCIPLLILMTLPFYRRYLGEEQGSHVKIDWFGGGLLVAALILLLLGVTKGTWLIALSGLLTLVLFIGWIRSVSEPFVQPELFKNKSYTLGLTIAFFASGIGFSLYFLSPLLLADVHQLSPSWISFAMVPAAAASAMLGQKGGKLADVKGNSHLFFVASGLLVSCFILLSTFIGSSPLYIALFLVLGNVGQTFMMIAMSHTVSMTLPKDQEGVGMGILAMVNFISGSIAVGIYGKLVDIGSEIPLNPVHMDSNGTVYSNLFFVLAAIYGCMVLFYYVQFGKSQKTRLDRTNPDC